MTVQPSMTGELPALTPGHAYADFIAKEADRLDIGSGRLLDLSTEVVLTCLELKEDPESPTADLHLADIAAKLKQTPQQQERGSQLDIDALAISNATALLTNRHKPLPSSTQAFLHKRLTNAAYSTLNYLYAAGDRLPQQIRGTLATRAGTLALKSLLSRQNSNWTEETARGYLILSLPSQSRGAVHAQNYDATYFCLYPRAGNYTAHKLHIARRCIEATTAAQDKADIETYNSDIALVSAHCDVLHPKDHDDQQPYMTIGSLILALKHDLHGKATEVEQRKLNYLHDKTISTMTLNPARRGRLSVQDTTAVIS